MSINTACPVDKGAVIVSFVKNHHAKNSIKGGKTYDKKSIKIKKAAIPINGANIFFTPQSPFCLSHIQKLMISYTHQVLLFLIVLMLLNYLYLDTYHLDN